LFKVDSLPAKIIRTRHLIANGDNISRVSTPPTTSTPPPAPPPGPPGPPPGYPAYPPYPPYPWYPPPRRDHTALIVIVVVLVLAVPFALSAFLYFMVSGLIREPSGTPPMVLLGPADLANGNATISITAASRSLSSSQVQILLAANNSASSPVGLPPPNGSVPVTTAGYVLRVFWLDNDYDGTLTRSDTFRITGNFARLPAATSFDFTLEFVYSGGDTRTSVNWTTP
jgi:hypothetical protein